MFADISPVYSTGWTCFRHEQLTIVGRLLIFLCFFFLLILVCLFKLEKTETASSGVQRTYQETNLHLFAENGEWGLFALKLAFYPPLLFLYIYI